MTDALLTVVVPDFVFAQLDAVEPVAEALDQLDGVINVYPNSAVTLEVDE